MMDAYAQTLAPVAAVGSTFNPWLFGGILLVVALVGGWLYWRKRNPVAATAAASTAGADIKAGFDRIVAAIEKHTAAVAPAAPTAAAAAPEATGPTPDQLAAVQSAQAALDAAKKAAGVA